MPEPKIIKKTLYLSDRDYKDILKFKAKDRSNKYLSFSRFALKTLLDSIKKIK